MRKKYYKLPLDVNELFQKKKNKPRLYCTLLDSITHHLQVVLMTSFKELRFDHKYGCIISDLDFSTEQQSRIFENQVQESIAFAVKKYEPRLKDCNTKVSYKREGEILKTSNTTRFKVYIIIHVDATIKKLEEKYSHTFKIFFSPLSESA